MIYGSEVKWYLILRNHQTQLISPQQHASITRKLTLDGCAFHLLPPLLRLKILSCGSGKGRGEKFQCERFSMTPCQIELKRCLTKIESDIQYQVPWKLIQEVYWTTTRNEHPQRTSGHAQVLIVLPPIAHVDTILKPCRECESEGQTWSWKEKLNQSANVFICLFYQISPVS